MRLFINQSHLEQGAQERLQGAFDRITDRLGLSEPKPKVLFRPADDGSQYFEWRQDGWDAVESERGVETRRLYCQHDTSALYQLTSGLTHAMAIEYECSQRVGDEDCRKVISARQSELMGKISSKWKKRVESEWADTFRAHPLREYET